MDAEHGSKKAFFVILNEGRRSEGSTRSDFLFTGLLGPTGVKELVCRSVPSLTLTGTSIASRRSFADAQDDIKESDLWVILAFVGSFDSTRGVAALRITRKTGGCCSSPGPRLLERDCPCN